MTKKEKSSAPTEHTFNSIDVIIAGKTYSVNKLNAIFNRRVLSLIDDKETLIEYWEMAVETGVKQYITKIIAFPSINEFHKLIFTNIKMVNINILKPDINLSGKNYIIEEKGIRYPLSNIRNVGIQGSEFIIKEY